MFSYFLFELIIFFFQKSNSFQLLIKLSLKLFNFLLLYFIQKANWLNENSGIYFQNNYFVKKSKNVFMRKRFGNNSEFSAKIWFYFYHMIYSKTLLIFIIGWVDICNFDIRITVIITAWGCCHLRYFILTLSNKCYKKMNRMFESKQWWSEIINWINNVSNDVNLFF